MPFSGLFMTGEQIRAARALLRIDQVDLASQTGLSLETIKRLERIRGRVDANSRTLAAIAEAFERLGVQLETGGGVGVRMGGAAAVAAPRQTGGQGAARPVEAMHRLIYFSSVDPPAATRMKHTLDDILEVSRRRNAALGLTGALLARNGRFLQLIEGEKSAVQQVYGAISSDPRHSGLRVVESRAVASRQFAGWELCCGVFDSDEPILRQESALAGGFDPETLTPASAVGLLSVMRDLQHAPPRDGRASGAPCPLAARCRDLACAGGVRKALASA